MALQNSHTGSLLTRAGTFLNLTTASWTIAFWYLPVSSTPTGSNYRQPYTIGDAGYVFIGSDIATNNILLELSDDGSTNFYDTAATATPLGTWLYCAAVYDSVAHNLLWYINNSLVSTLSHNLSSGFNFGTRAEVGLTGLWLDDALSYQRTWQTALTPAQLLAEQNSPTAVLATNLLADCPLTGPGYYTDVSGASHPWSATMGGSLLYVTGPLPPLNLTALTATVIPSLPYSQTLYTQDAPTGTDGGANEVWYRYTATSADEAIGFLPWAANAANYRPQSKIYLGPPNAPATYLGGFQGTREATQVLVTAGTTYYIRVINSGTQPLLDSLHFAAYEGPPRSAVLPPGTLLITDDEAGGFAFGYPAVALDQTTGAVLRLPPMAAADIGDVSADGKIFLVSDANETIQYLYNPDFSLNQTFTTIVPNTSYLQSVRSDGAHTFFLGWSFTGAAGRDSVTTITSSGTVGPTTWVLAQNMLGIAPSRDRTILYYINGIVNTPIYRWDLVNNVALSNLVAGIAGYVIQKDLLVLADGTILAGYTKASPLDYNVIRYSPAGAVLNTYAFGAETRNRLGIALDDPLSFWVWIDAAGGLSRYRRIRVADGTVLNDWSIQQFEGGVSALATPVQTPTFPFGPSESCPLLVLRSEVVPPSPPPVYLTVPTRRMRRTPHLNQEHKRINHNQLEVLAQVGVGLTLGTPGTDPQIMLRWSDDGGLTWSEEYWNTLGKIGDTLSRVKWNRLGQARDRVYELVVSDPVNAVLINAYLDSAIGGN